LDGAWTLFDAGFNEAFSKRAADEFLHLMNDEKKRMRRLGKVGLWSIQSLMNSMLHVFDMDDFYHPF
jgi:hypothetical protein